MLNNHLNQISYLLTFFMIFGVIATSISGATRAIESKMDISGAILLAFITSNAGGTVRDIILKTTPFWITNQLYIWLTFSIGAITFILVLYNRNIIDNKKLRTILILSDAMGLAAFSLAGVEKSLNFSQSNIVSVIIGVCTAVGGGVIADIIVNRIPLVFSQELYISIALLGSIIYLLLANYTNHIIAALIAALLMILLRLYSVKYKWKLPTVS